MWIRRIAYCGWDWKDVLLENIIVVVNILKGMVSFAWHCYICVPSRDDNCRLANRQLFVLRILFRIDWIGVHRSTYWEKWPTVVWHWRAQPPLRLFGSGEPNRSRSVMENRIGVPSLEIAREGNCPLIMERDTVSNHIVKNRCLNAPWWHNASLGECEGCWVIHGK